MNSFLLAVRFACGDAFKMLLRGMGCCMQLAVTEFSLQNFFAAKKNLNFSRKLIFWLQEIEEILVRCPEFDPQMKVFIDCSGQKYCFGPNSDPKEKIKKWAVCGAKISFKMMAIEKKKTKKKSK